MSSVLVVGGFTVDGSLSTQSTSLDEGVTAAASKRRIQRPSNEYTHDSRI